MSKENQILDTDSYKFSMVPYQYPSGTEYVSSYIESRGGEYDKTVFFGLQMYLKEVLSQPITKADVEEAKDMVLAHGEPFNEKLYMDIINKHGGYWPMRIQALKEGTVMPTGIPQVQIMNTDPKIPATTLLETALLRAIWYPSTVATISYHGKQIIKKYLMETADTLDGLLFKLHDFGARGVSSRESAGIGGSAHLVNFMGTDTVMGLVYTKRYYGESMAGFSIPAAEHSTITSWGKRNEAKAYQNMLKQFAGKSKLVAVVSDSYNIYNAVENIWCGELKTQLENQGGTVVIRPDSGDPTTVPVELLNILGAKLGFTINTKGYKMLPPYVRIIQGDGVNLKSIEQCLANIKKAGWSTDNIAFGMGGELLQKLNRDTLKYAMKASSVCVNGVWHDVFKQPVGDKSKASKAGRQAVILNNKSLVPNKNVNELICIKEENIDINDKNLLEDVWLNGELLRDQSFKEIRELANK